MTTVRNKFIGITHPIPDEVMNFKEFTESWRTVNCANGIHCFDEVHGIDMHYLHCDICGLEVHIKEIVIPDGSDKILE